MRAAIYIFVLTFILGCDGFNRREPAPKVDQQARWRELAQQYQANLGWVKKIAKIARQDGRILTTDLQREWLSGPIVFPGVLSDATRIDPDRYVLHIQDDGFLLHAFDQSVILSLECSAAQAEPIIQSGKATDAYPTKPTLLVVARISSVSGRRYLETDRNVVADDDHPGSYTVEAALAKDWKVGYGQCVHIELLAAT